MGNSKTSVWLLKPCTNSFWSHCIPVLHWSPVLLHWLWNLPVLDSIMDLFLHEVVNVTYIDTIMEFSKTGKRCGQAALGVQLCYGLTVRSSCLFWVAMQSSVVDNFSSSHSSGATSLGNPAYQEEKVSIIKWNLITQITMKQMQDTKISLSHSGH